VIKRWATCTNLSIVALPCHVAGSRCFVIYRLI
jgi:hypothetical protein